MKRKLMALLLGATMLMGSVLPVGATEADDGSVSSNDAVGSVSTNAAILSLNVTKLVVPTDLDVVFNPEGWAVDVGDVTGKTDQVLSTNYGIMNKSNKAKLFNVTFEVSDLNEGDDKVVFVDAKEKATAATDDDHYLYLEAIPATVAASAFSVSTSANDLADLGDDATAVSENAISLHSGTGTLSFVLDKATYELKGTLSANSITSNTVDAELDSVSSNGCYGFTFGGNMNTKADWSKLTKGINVKVTYDVEDAAYNAKIGIQDSDAAPSLTAGNVFTLTKAEHGGNSFTIPMSKGAGTKAATAVTSVTCGGGSVTSDKYTLSDDGFVLASTFVDAIVNSSNTGDREFIVELNDTAKTKLTFTIKR